MRKNIEFYFQNSENLDKVFDAYDETFDRIKYFEDSLKAGAVDNPVVTQEVLKELVAIYSWLNVTTKIAESYKETAEAKHYTKLKMEAETKGEKVSNASLEKETDLFISNYRRICNIFTGYRDSCDRMISVLQSCLKSTDREKSLPHD